METPKGHFEIIWPLAQCFYEHKKSESQTNPCFQNENSGCRLTGQICSKAKFIENFISKVCREIRLYLVAKLSPHFPWGCSLTREEHLLFDAVEESNISALFLTYLLEILCTKNSKNAPKSSSPPPFKRN